MGWVPLSSWGGGAGGGVPVSAYTFFIHFVIFGCFSVSRVDFSVKWCKILVMVLIRCDVRDGLLLRDLVPFQGRLKKRTEADVEGLASSIRSEGLLMPFVVWRHEGKDLLLDGHGRRLALEEIAKVDPDVAGQELPVIFVDADTEEEARKALLQITSSYGKVSKWGVREFTKSIPEYHAPVIDGFRRGAVRRRAKGAVNKSADAGEAEIKIMVRREKVQAVLELFRQVDYIRVCGYVE